MQKRMITLAILFCIGGLRIYAQDIYNDFLKFKVAFYNTESREGIPDKIEAQRKKIEASALSEEEKLTLSSLLIVEHTDMTGKANAKQNYLLLKEQNNRCTVFMDGKKESDINPWLLIGWANIKSRLTVFLSGQDMYDEAYRARRLYTETLKQRKKFSQGYFSYGLWLFCAPPAAGGGTEAALKEFSKAVSYAKTPEEKYLALLYRSQAYVELGNEKKASADLQAAHALFPGEIFTRYAA